ncbi:MAG: hypothetical protein H3C59_15160 [Burkholderiaceae bacterium]|nr:hypothetical protein [Burkholderiaceae bacterium]
MVRRLISLLFAVALLGVTGQGVAYAARGPDPMQSAHMTMPMADCMKMMEQAAPADADTPGKHRGGTLADCLGDMIACAGIAVAVPDTIIPALVAYDHSTAHRPGLASPLHGRSLAPDIQPPIA